MKFGLDHDGVISAKPEVFAALSSALVAAGHEVHVLTGNRGTPEFIESMMTQGIEFTHFFSISDFHHKIGTPMTGYETNETRFDERLWNRTKGDYCREHGIDLHIDDSEEYGKHFSTPYCFFDRKLKPFEEIKPGDEFRVRLDDEGDWLDEWNVFTVSGTNVTIEGWRVVGFEKGSKISRINYDMYAENLAIEDM